MFIIADWILVLGTLATCFYCWTVSRSLRKVQARTIEMLQALEGLEGRAEAVRDAGRRVIADLKWVESALVDERSRGTRTLEVVGEQIEQIRAMEGRAGAVVERLLEAAQASREAKLELNETMTDFEAIRSVAAADVVRLEEAANRLAELDHLKGEVIETKKSRSRARASQSRKPPSKTSRTRKAAATKASAQEQQMTFEDVEHFEPVG